MSDSHIVCSGSAPRECGMNLSAKNVENSVVVVMVMLAL